MSSLSDRLGLPAYRGPRLLVVGAHVDDAEIGAGGTIARLVRERPDLAVTWVVLAADDAARAAEGRASAARLLEGVTHEILLRDLRDGYLPYLGTAAKEALAAVAGVEPDLILGPRRDDAHQDHRLIGELVPQVFRDATVLEYEVPKWDGDLGAANVYVPLTRSDAAAKVELLLTAFPSQRGRAWYTDETFGAVLRLRGIECRAQEGVAEAFVCRKLVL